MMNNLLMDRRDVAATMSGFRNALRSGQVRITRLPGREFESVLRHEIAAQFGLKPTDWNTENFRPATLKRFADFFAFPHHFDNETGSYHLPTQDEIAWAVQNFINRRKNPWNRFVARALGELVQVPNVTNFNTEEDRMVVNSEEQDNFAETNDDIAERLSRT